MNDVSTTDLTATIDTYLAAWNEHDPDHRRTMIEQVWAPDGRLIDPPLAGEGHTGISEMADAMHEHFAGHSFRRSSGIDIHHDQVRFAWEAVGPDGAVAIAGLDTGELGADGRLLRVVGYFGDLPPLEA